MAQALVYEITNAGLAAAAALIEASLKIEFVKISIGSGHANAGYLPAGNETTLKGEFARFPISSISRAGRDLFFEATYDGPAEGWIREVGLFIKNTAGQDTLFAIWSSTEFNLGHKTLGSPYIFMETVTLSRIPADKVNVTAQPPSLQLLFVTPIAQISTEIIRLQRRAIQSENARLIPQIQNRWS